MKPSSAVGPVLALALCLLPGSSSDAQAVGVTIHPPGRKEAVRTATMDRAAVAHLFTEAGFLALPHEPLGQLGPFAQAVDEASPQELLALLGTTKMTREKVLLAAGPYLEKVVGFDAEHPALSPREAAFMNTAAEVILSPQAIFSRHLVDLLADPTGTDVSDFQRFFIASRLLEQLREETGEDLPMSDPEYLVSSLLAQTELTKAEEGRVMNAWKQTCQQFQATYATAIDCRF